MMTDPREGRGPAGIETAGTKTAQTKAVKVKSARTKVAEIVAVCSKCARRQGLRPRAVRVLLEQAAKRAAKDGRLPRKAIRVVSTGCLGPCPKRAVAVATGASLAEGRVRLIDPGAGPEAALAALVPARLLPEFGPIAHLAPVDPDESPPAPRTAA